MALMSSGVLCRSIAGLIVSLVRDMDTLLATLKFKIVFPLVFPVFFRQEQRRQQRRWWREWEERARGELLRQVVAAARPRQRRPRRAQRGSRQGRPHIQRR